MRSTSRNQSSSSRYHWILTVVFALMMIAGQATRIGAQGNVTLTPTPIREGDPGSRTNPLINPCTKQTFLTIMTGAALRSAEARVGFGPSDWQVYFALDPDHPETKAFGDFTASNIGQRLAIVLDGKVLSAPIVQARLGTEGIISGQFTRDEMISLALQLNSGALPVDLEIASIDQDAKGLRIVLSPTQPTEVSMLSTLEALRKRMGSILVLAAYRDIKLDAQPEFIVRGGDIVLILPSALAEYSAQILDTLIETGFLEFVDFSRPSDCTADMPAAGTYILTTARAARQIGNDGAPAATPQS